MAKKKIMKHTDPNDEVSLVIKLTLGDKEVYSRLAADCNMSQTQLMHELIDELRLEEGASGVPVITAIRPECRKALREKIGDQRLCDFLEGISYGIAPPEASREEDVFTKTDIISFVEICQTRRLNPRFAMSKCIEALRMRKI